MRRLRGDRGITLVETLVTATLLFVVVTLMTTSYIVGIRAANTSAARADATMTAARALDTITRELRTAVPADSTSRALITSAAADQVEFSTQFETNRDKKPTTVKFYLDPVSWDPVTGSPMTWELVSEVAPDGGTPRRRVLATQVRDKNVFSYLDKVPDDSTPLQPLSPLPLPASDLCKVRAVDTTLTVGADDKGAAPNLIAHGRAFLVNANKYLNPDVSGGPSC